MEKGAGGELHAQTKSTHEPKSNRQEKGAGVEEGEGREGEGGGNGSEEGTGTEFGNIMHLQTNIKARLADRETYRETEK